MHCIWLSWSLVSFKLDSSSVSLSFMTWLFESYRLVSCKMSLNLDLLIFSHFQQDYLKMLLCLSYIISAGMQCQFVSLLGILNFITWLAHFMPGFFTVKPFDKYSCSLINKQSSIFWGDTLRFSLTHKALFSFIHLFIHSFIHSCISINQDLSREEQRIYHRGITWCRNKSWLHSFVSLLFLCLELHLEISLGGQSWRASGHEMREARMNWN